MRPVSITTIQTPLTPLEFNDTFLNANSNASQDLARFIGSLPTAPSHCETIIHFVFRPEHALLFDRHAISALGKFRDYAVSFVIVCVGFTASEEITNSFREHCFIYNAYPQIVNLLPKA